MIRKTFLEAMETIQMKSKSGYTEPDKNQQSLFKDIEDEHSIEGNPKIKEFYDKVRMVSDKPEEIEKLRKISIDRGMTKEVFNQLLKKMDEEQPFLSKEMKKMEVANISTLTADVKKLNDLFKEIKTSITLKNLYKQSLRVILKKFFLFPGTKIPRRYIILPMRYDNTNQSINKLNTSENKYENIFKMLKNDIDIEKEEIDRDIIVYLKKYDYELNEIDFYNNICRNKNGVELKITDEFEKIKTNVYNLASKEQSLQKAPEDKKEFIRNEINKAKDFKIEYLTRMLSFNIERSTGFGDEKVVIITWVPRLVLTQSTGTAWTSCQNLLTGGFRESVITGMQEGVFIAWLVNLKDSRTIRKPMARILIKPFKAKTGSDIIWWTSKVYSESGGDYNLFYKVVNKFLYLRQQVEFDQAGGTKIDFGLMSKKPNKYQRDDTLKYRIYPDDEKAVDVKKFKFDDVISSKKLVIKNVFSTVDFTETKLLNFLKSLDKKKLQSLIQNKTPIDGSLINEVLASNLTQTFNYIIQLMKKEDLYSYDEFIFDNDVNNSIAKIYLAYLEGEYLKNGFENIDVDDLIIKISNNKYMINYFFNSKMFKDVIISYQRDITLKDANRIIDFSRAINYLENNQLDMNSKKLIINRIAPITDIVLKDAYPITVSYFIKSVFLFKVNKNSPDIYKKFQEDFKNKIDTFVKNDKEYKFLDYYFENAGFDYAHMFDQNLRFIKYLEQNNPKMLKKHEDKVFEFIDSVVGYSNIGNEYDLLNVLKYFLTLKVVNGKSMINKIVDNVFSMTTGREFLDNLCICIKTTDDLDFIFNILKSTKDNQIAFVHVFLELIDEGNFKVSDYENILNYLFKQYKSILVAYNNSGDEDNNLKNIAMAFSQFEYHETEMSMAIMQDSKYFNFYKNCYHIVTDGDDEMKMEIMFNFITITFSKEQQDLKEKAKIVFDFLLEEIKHINKNLIAKKIKKLDFQIDKDREMIYSLLESLKNKFIHKSESTSFLFDFFEKFNVMSMLGNLYIDNLKYRQEEFHETIPLENLTDVRYVNMFNYLQEHNENFKKKYFELNFYVKTTQAYAPVAMDITTNTLGANRFIFLADFLNYSKNETVKKDFLESLQMFFANKNPELTIKNLMLSVFKGIRFDNILKDQNMALIFKKIKKEKLLEIFKDMKYSNYQDSQIDKLYVKIKK